MLAITQTQRGELRGPSLADDAVVNEEKLAVLDKVLDDAAGYFVMNRNEFRMLTERQLDELQAAMFAGAQVAVRSDDGEWLDVYRGDLSAGVRQKIRIENILTGSSPAINFDTEEQVMRQGRAPHGYFSSLAITDGTFMVGAFLLHQYGEGDRSAEGKVFLSKAIRDFGFVNVLFASRVIIRAAA